jgi:hypothetical protein
MTPHTQRLERWLGAEQVAELSFRMAGYHGGPIPIANLPGNVFVHKDGNFSGQIYGGRFTSLADVVESAHRRVRRAVRRAAQSSTVHTGFSSVADLVAKAKAGNRQEFVISKAGGAGIASAANSLWDVGTNPPAGGAATAAPGGHSPDNTTLGGLKQVNPGGGDTLHFTGTTIVMSTGGTVIPTLLLYDRFFACNHDMTVDPRTVTGVPTRYQSTASKNTFITVFVTTVLPAATPTYTITYMDQDGNTAEAAAAQTIASGAVVGRFPFSVLIGNGWFIPLNTPDSGVRKITNLDLSAAMASGFVDVVLCKPYVWIPCPLPGYPTIIDGINSCFNMVQITDSSCLALMEVQKSQPTAANYNGTLSLVAG